MATNASAFIEKRPGDALNRYLGVVQSDALYQRIGRLVVDERAKCYSENGLTPPAEDSMDVPRSRTASLKGNDTAAFRSKHGFGVVAEYLESLETTRKTSATAAKPSDLATAQSAKAGDVAAKCAARTASVINENLAPAQMHALTRALMKDYGDSKAYRDLSESWRACMASAGYRTRYGPYESRAMAEDFLQKHLQDALMRSFERRGAGGADRVDPRILPGNSRVCSGGAPQSGNEHLRRRCAMPFLVGGRQLDVQRGERNHADATTGIPLIFRGGCWIGTDHHNA